MPFEYASFPHPVREDLVAAHGTAWSRLAEPGCWWTGEQRVAIAREVRAARAARSDPPWLRKAPTGRDLPRAAIDAARRVAADAHPLDRDACRALIDALGDAPYVELVGVVVCVTAIDAFAEALGVELEPLPEPVAGEPSRERPENVGDAGAYVPMATPWPGPNVGRALSLVPPAAQTFFSLVGPMYSGREFANLVWANRPLSRPQVELIAARVSAVSECFY